MRKQFYFKKVFVLLSVIVLAMSSKQVNAQVTGSGIFFQAVARDGFSNPAKDRNIVVETSLVQTAANGTVVLTERFNATTDASGVFNVSIGEGTRIGGSVANFKGIDWSKGPFFLNVKIAIAPIVNPSNWDYTKDLVDLGTSPFGAVPYALFAAQVAGFDTKMNVADTAKMLLPYAKVANLNSLVTNKVNIADSITQYVTPTQLAAKTFDQTPILNSIATKLNIADSITKYVTPAQLAAKTFDSTTIYNQLALKATTTTVNSSLATKLNISDSITKYVTPAQLAAKTFDSTAIYNQLALKANITDVNTALALKANDAAVTTALGTKENTANKSLDVSLDGTSDVKFPSVKAIKTYVDASITANTTPLTFSAPLSKSGFTVSIPQANGSNNGYLNSSDWTSFNNKIDATQKAAANGVATLGNDGKIPSVQIPAISFQNVSVVNSSSAMTSISGAQVGSIAIRTDNNNNYVLSALPASTLSNWIALATPIYVSTVNGFAGPNVVLTTNDVSEGANNKYYTDARVRGALSATAPLSFNSSTGAFSIPQASLTADGFLSATDWNTFKNKQNALVAGTDYVTPAQITLSSLGAEPTANKSNDVAGDALSTTKFPSVKAIKDYVDLQSANAGVADNSITSAKISGTIAIGKGGTGATTAAAARTNLGLVIGTDVMAATATTTLTGDVTGSGNGSFATTVNSVGGITASTIAGLPTSVSANTASITANTNSIATLNTNVSANTASITSNTNSIAILNTNVSTNTASITAETTRATNAENALDTRVSSNTTSITANTNSITTLNTNVSANTASITAETTRATNAENALDTRVTSNTASITTNSADILLRAPLASPAFTGTPTAPTPATNDNSTTLATTAYVKNSITAANAGLSSIGAISATSNVKGATISGTTELILTPADASNGGVVTTGTQTFAGSKTFTNTATFNTDITVNGLTVGRGNFSSNTNTALGSLALYLNTSGVGNTAIGQQALNKVVNTNYNTAIGRYSSYYTIGSYNTSIGNQALYGASGLSTGSSNTAIGASSMFAATTASNNVSIGVSALTNNTTGNNNVALGYAIGAQYGTGSGADLTKVDQAVLIGSNVRTGTNTSTNETVIGYNAIGNGSNTVTIGNASNTANYFTGDINLTGYVKGGTWSGTTIGSNYGGAGTVNGIMKADGAGVVTAIDAAPSTGQFLTSAAGGTYTWTSSSAVTGNFVPYTGATGAVDLGAYDLKVNGLTVGRGNLNLLSNTGFGVDVLNSVNNSGGQGTGLTSVGYRALKLNTTGSNNNAFGYYSLYFNTTGGANAAFGSQSLYTNTSGGNNAAYGYQALFSNSTGNLNSAFGSLALYNNNYGSRNTAIGYKSLYSTASSSSAGTDGDYNTALGYMSGNTNTTGSNNTFLGYSADAAIATLTNATAIGNGAIVNASNTVQIGNYSVTSVVTSGTISATGFTGPLTGNASTATSLATGRTISTTGDVAYTSGSFDGTTNVTGTATLTNTSVTAGTYGSSTAIPTFTVDSKGRLTAASTVGITAGVSSLNYTSTSSYAAGGTISGTSLTLTAADANNPGLVSTGAQSFAGAKTFGSDVVVNGMTIGKGGGNILNNTAIGYNALTSNLAGGTPGINNTAIGYNSLSSNTTGGNNVAIGNSAGSVNVGGSNNVFIGNNANAASGLVNNANAIAIGSNAIVDAPNKIQLGDQNITAVNTSGVITASGFIGSLTGNASTATTATTAGNITATSNTTLTSLANLATVGTITSGTWSATEIAIAKGGTGATTASGARTNLGLGSIATKSTIADADVDASAAIAFSKLNITKANITSLGIQDGLTAGSGISISSSTISVTGLTTSNLASNAAITNSQLANSTTTLGSTTMTLGGTVTSVTGLTSVTSTGFTGALTGNASTATKLAATKNINGVAFDGSADITIAADANTLTGTTLASNVVNSSLTSVGTITSGVWSGTAIANNKLANSTTILGSTTMTLGGTVTSVTGLTSLTATTVVGNLSGTATTATNIAGGLVGSIPYQTAAGTTALLAGNTTSTVKYLASSGNGTNSTAPTWVTPSFVPYTGATAAVDLGAYDLTVNGITVGRGNTGDGTNTALGASALLANTAGTDNSALGYYALKKTTGSYNSAFGSLAMENNTSGVRNAAFGPQAVRMNSTGNYNSGFGYSALYGVTTASDNTAIGYLAGYNLTTGAKNILIGSNAGATYSTGTSANTTGLNSVLIGYDVRPLANGDNNEIVLSGYNGTAGTIGLGSNSTSIGSSTTTKTRIYGALTTVPAAAVSTSMVAGESSTIEAQGTTGGGAPGSVTLKGGSASTSANGGDINLTAGNGASSMTGGNINLTPGTGAETGSVKVIGADLFIYDNSFRVGKGKGYKSANTVLGNNALNSNTLGNSNTAIGSGTLYNNTSGESNTAVGSSALTANTTGGSNTALGQNALKKNTTGADNVAIGSNALGNNTTGNYNIGIGTLANGEVSSANTNNIGIGWYALRYNNADRNIALGYAAGGGLGYNSSTAGANNIFLGFSAGYSAGSASTINTTGANSVLIGYDVRPADIGETNEIVISGYNGTAGTVGQGSNTTSIGNANTTKSVIYGSILSNLPAVSTTGSGGDFTIEAQDAIATGNTNGGNINLTPGNSNGTGTPGKVNVNSVINVAAGTATASVNGLSSAITAQNGGTGNTNGGNISLTAGTPSGTGAGGNITLTPGAFSGTASSTSGYVNIPMGTTSANWGVNVSGSVDDFLEYNIKNNSTGTKAQSGFNAIANNGTETSNFVWMGINNQNFNNPQTYNVGSANDVTFMGAGNDLHVANANNSKSIIFSTGISTTPYFSERMRITSTGNVGIGTNSPTATLEVAGQVKITGGTPGVGKVLTSDANGLATWKSGVSAVTRATLSSAGTTNLTTDQNYFIVLSTSVTGQVINLPDATANAGKEYTIKNLSAFSLNITATAGKLVQDNSTTSSTSASVGIEPSNNWIKVISDGTDWIVFRALF